MPFKSSDAASSCCSNRYHFYVIEFASSAAAKLEIAAAKALPFRDLLTSLADSSGAASEASKGSLGQLHRQLKARH